MARSKHHTILNEEQFISKCWCFLTDRKHLASAEGSCFLHRKMWENTFLMHGSRSALFISIHLILYQQGQQEIFSLKASVFHWSFLKNICNCSMKITTAEYKSLEKYIIITQPPVCTSWSPLKSVVFVTLTWVYLRE